MRDFPVGGRSRMNAPENIGHGEEKAIIRPGLRDFLGAPVDTPDRRDEQYAGNFLVAIRRREYAGKLFALPRRVRDVCGDHCNVPSANRAESLRSANTNITGKRVVKEGRFHRLSFKTQEYLIDLLDERPYRVLGASVASVLPPCSLRPWLHPSP